MVDFRIPLGTPEGDGNRAMPFRTDDPDTIPDGLKWLSIEEIRGGRLEIVKGRPTYIRFYRDGVEVPVREYVLIPGKKVFTLIYRYQGKDKRKTNWTFLPDGWCDIEQFDAEGNIVDRTTIVFKHMQIGEQRRENVEVVVVKGIDYKFIINRTGLLQFGKYEFDKQRSRLIFLDE